MSESSTFLWNELLIDDPSSANAREAPLRNEEARVEKQRS
jgi:hypothetical protein